MHLLYSGISYFPALAIWRLIMCHIISLCRQTDKSVYGFKQVTFCRGTGRDVGWPEGEKPEKPEKST